MKLFLYLIHLHFISLSRVCLAHITVTRLDPLCFCMNPVQSSLAESIFKACYTYSRVEDKAQNESGLLKIKPRLVSSPSSRIHPGSSAHLFHFRGRGRDRSSVRRTRSFRSHLRTFYAYVFELRLQWKHFILQHVINTLQIGSEQGHDLWRAWLL